MFGAHQLLTKLGCYVGCAPKHSVRVVAESKKLPRVRVFAASRNETASQDSPRRACLPARSGFVLLPVSFTFITVSTRIITRAPGGAA